VVKKLIKWGLIVAVALLIMYDGLTYVLAFLDLDDVSRTAVAQAGMTASSGRDADDSYEAAAMVTEPEGVAITGYHQDDQKVILWTSADLEGTALHGYLIAAAQSKPTPTIDQEHSFTIQ
jgi:hypothetical protein